MPHPMVVRIAGLVVFLLVLTLVLWRRRQRS
jgi:hypothetical protein